MKMISLQKMMPDIKREPFACSCSFFVSNVSIQNNFRKHQVSIIFYFPNIERGGWVKKQTNKQNVQMFLLLTVFLRFEKNKILHLWKDWRCCATFLPRNGMAAESSHVTSPSEIIRACLLLLTWIFADPSQDGSVVWATGSARPWHIRSHDCIWRIASARNISSVLVNLGTAMRVTRHVSISCVQRIFCIRGNSYRAADATCYHIPHVRFRRLSIWSTLRDAGSRCIPLPEYKN